jgi:hypothetical protein
MRAAARQSRWRHRRAGARQARAQCEQAVACGGVAPERILGAGGDEHRLVIGRGDAFGAGKGALGIAILQLDVGKRSLRRDVAGLRGADALEERARFAAAAFGEQLLRAREIFGGGHVGATVRAVQCARAAAPRQGG